MSETQVKITPSDEDNLRAANEKLKNERWRQGISDCADRNHRERRPAVVLTPQLIQKYMDKFGVKDYVREQIEPVLEKVVTDFNNIKKVTPEVIQGKIDKAIKDVVAVKVAVAEVKAEVVELPSAESPQMVFSFLATDATRVSPFTILSKKAMGHRIHEKISWDNPWGRITVEGQRLSIYDEDVLLAVLHLYAKKRTLTIHTSYHELCGLIGSAWGAHTCAALRNTLKRLTSTLVTLETPDKKTGKMRERMWHTMLTGGTSAGNTKLNITINPYFEEVYLQDLITSLDMDFRRALSTDIAKALYRFLTAQPVKYSLSIAKLIKVVNINTDQESWHIKGLIKKGLTELKNKKYLKSFKIDRFNIIHTVRAEVKPRAQKYDLHRCF